MEESASGQISLKLGDQQQSVQQDSRGRLSMNSPHYMPDVSNQAAKSAKVQRKGMAKTNIDTTLPQSSERMQLLKSKDPMNTPKLHQLQEVHKTTIMEENETMRGSMDRGPLQKLGMHSSAAAGRKFNRVQQ